MTPTRHLPTVLIAMLALLAWLPGALWAGGGTCPLLAKASAAGSPAVAPPCCPRNAERSFRMADCCRQPLAMAPVMASRAAESPVALAPPGPVELASEPLAVRFVLFAEGLPSPPEGVPLYTLHATLLI